MTYKTQAEKYFDKLRRLLLEDGYDKSHYALRSLSSLRKAMRVGGYSFTQSSESTEEVNNG